MSGAGSWRTVVGIGFIWPAILAVGIQFMPESPRWLASRGRLDEAQRALAVARGIKASEAESNRYLRREAEDIRASVEYERSVRGGWLDCFRVENKTLYRTFLGVYSSSRLHPSLIVRLRHVLAIATATHRRKLLFLLWSDYLCFCWYLRLFRDADHPGHRQLCLHLWWFVCNGEGKPNS